MPIIPASDIGKWRAQLAHMGEMDSTYLPEYHLAYSLRIEGSTPLLWYYESGEKHFCYPFLLTPVLIGGEPTGYHDISSMYGYTGPLARSTESAFLAEAWQAFDNYTHEQNIIAEFIRFSPFNNNENMAHPKTNVEENRKLAASYLPDNEEGLLKALGAKTRNMLRKAERSGLVSRELALPEYLPAFRTLYDETMSRNQAPEFFLYDDAYWNELLKLKEGLRLFGVFAEDKLVAAAMAVVHGKSGLYHLGASLPDYARQGAGNLSMFEMSRSLMKDGVNFINMTGGRTTAGDDPLLLFKKSNATGLANFYIGKRVINHEAYQQVTDKWQAYEGHAPGVEKIIFWRH